MVTDKAPRRIGVVTVGRSDYGIYRPILDKLREDKDIDLQVIAAGMHLSPEFGMTYRDIETDGFHIAHKVEMLLSSDTPAGIAKSMGLGIMGFAEAFGETRLDLLVVLGDRFEMYSAAAAALPFNIPVAHIHGGEVTQGAMDDALRHSITKLSHLHFTSTQAYADRVAQMGEESWRIVVSGAPALDHLKALAWLSVREIEVQFDISLTPPPLLVTFHPVTREFEHTEAYVEELLAALERTAMPVVFTLPNADTHGRRIIQRLRAYVAHHSEARVVGNFGMRAYFSMMRHAAAMVGNSSSGLIEAPSLKLPVVNIGTRQQGRLRAANVIDTGYGREDILRGIRKAVSEAFRNSLENLENPYGNGHAAEIIVNRLKSVSLDGRLRSKAFVDRPVKAPHGKETKSGKAAA